MQKPAIENPSHSIIPEFQSPFPHSPLSRLGKYEILKTLKGTYEIPLRKSAFL